MPEWATIIRNRAINSIVKSAQAFGYPGCNRHNVLKDYCYATFAKAMIEDALPQLTKRELEKRVLTALLEECKATIAKGLTETPMIDDAKDIAKARSAARAARRRTRR